MDIKAEHRYAKISAFKVREVTREIQGLPAEQALEIVRLIPKKAARLLGKVLASAIANAENNNNSENKTLRAENLVVKPPWPVKAPHRSACIPAPGAAAPASTSARRILKSL